jgi:hypothetical protein
MTSLLLDDGDFHLHEHFIYSDYVVPAAVDIWLRANSHHRQRVFCMAPPLSAAGP